MIRRVVEVWERIYYLYSLRGEYFRIQYRYLLRSTERWTKLRPYRNWLILILISIAAVAAGLAGYSQSWTGFASQFTPTGGSVPSKKLWDWMDLLLIPILLAGIAYFLSRSQSRRQISVSLLNKREEALQNYFDQMTHLLLDIDYQDEDQVETGRRMARARTITVLEMLDGKQKGHLVRFLVEADLIDRYAPSVNMARANLKKMDLEPGLYSGCNLHGVNLDGASLAWCNLTDSDIGSSSIRHADLESTDMSSSNLDYTDFSGSDMYKSRFFEAQLIKARFEDANLEQADFRRATIRTAKMLGANLRRAALTKAYLKFADFRFANLTDADLSDADLSHANFYGAKLRGANLSGADLTNAHVSKRQLRSARSIERATLPEGLEL